MAERVFTSFVDFGDKVIVDNDKDLIATVTGFRFFTQDYMIEISFCHDGEFKTAWIERWRVSAI